MDSKSQKLILGLFWSIFFGIAAYDTYQDENKGVFIMTVVTLVLGVISLILIKETPTVVEEPNKSKKKTSG